MKNFILFLSITLFFQACGEIEDGSSNTTSPPSSSSNSEEVENNNNEEVTPPSTLTQTLNPETMSRIEWKHSYQRTFRKYTVIDSDDNFYSLHLEDLPHRAVITKVDPEGSVIWKKSVKFNSKINLSYIYHGELKIDKKNNLYLVGSGHKRVDNQAPNNYFSKAFVIKFSSSGEKIWEHIEVSSIKTYGEALVIDHNENVYFIGRDEQKNLSLIKLNKSGKKIMQKSYNSYPYDFLGKVDIILSKDKESIYLLTYKNVLNLNDLSIIKTSLDGTEIWSKSYETVAKFTLVNIVAFQEDNNGDIVVALNQRIENQDNNMLFDIKLFKINSNGFKLWEALYGTDESDRVHYFTLDKKNNIFITGYTKGAFDGFENYTRRFDIFLSKISPEGDLLKTDQIKTFGVQASNPAGGNFIGFNKKNNLFLAGDRAISQDLLSSSFLIKYQ